MKWWVRLRELPLQTKALFGSLFFMSAIFGITSFVTVSKINERIEIGQRSSVYAKADSIAVACELPMSVGDTEEIKRQLQRFLMRDSEILFIGAFDDENGLVARAVRESSAWERYRASNQEAEDFLLARVAIELSGEAESFDVFETPHSNPKPDGVGSAVRQDASPQAVAPEGGTSHLGWITVGLSTKSMRSAMHEQARILLGIFFAAGALLIPAQLFLVQRWVHRLGLLVDSAGAISGGDLTPRPVDPVMDELGKLSNAFESMRGALAEREREMRDFNEALRQRVEARTFDLARAKEEAEAANRSKSEFLANISHELRSPLTLLISPLEAMLAGDFGMLSEVEREHVELMHVNALRLLELINNLLDLSKIESRQLTLERMVFDLRRLLESVVSGMRWFAEHKGIELRLSGLDTLSHIEADPEAMTKVIVNLLGNALKFTDRGGHIEIAARPDADQVHIYVKDDGVGIPRDQLERIFDRFAQVETATTRRHAGTGIGLALAKELVTLHGGKIWAESDGPGCGACFHLQIPVGDIEEATGRVVYDDSEVFWQTMDRSLRATRAEIEAEARAPRVVDHVERERVLPDAEWPESAEVLIVDDNAEMRNFLAFLLGREFRIRTARHGKEALQMVQTAAPDLVITDVMMPELSGTDLCRTLKADPQTRGIPVVLLTSKAQRESRLEGLELGAEDFIAKPFHPRELMARVRALVRLRRLQSEIGRRNIALRQANARLQSTSREIELYARAVSHDLRSPLAAASESLRVADTAQPAERERFLALARENLYRADRMLVGLRELMRTVGSAEPVATFSVQTVVQEVIRELRLVRTDHPATIEIVGDLGRIEGRENKIVHVFRNLLMNALTHSQNRSDLHVEVGREEHGEEVLFYVRDNGEGIPYEYQAKIFEPFRRGPNSPPESMGLGLALVEQIVEQHGGAVWVESDPGQGACFWFSLPKIMKESDSQVSG